MNGPLFVSRFVDRLVFALVNAQLYGTSHVRVREAAADAAKALSEYGAAVRTPSVVLAVVDSQVVFEGRPVIGASLYAKRLLRRIEELGAGGIEFQVTVRDEDMAHLIASLARRSEPGESLETASRDLEGRGVQGIKFLPTYAPGAGPASGGEPLVTDRASLVRLHQGTVDLLQGVTITVCQGHDIDFQRVQEVVDGMVQGLATDGGCLHSLAHYPDHDFFTFGHSIRVALLALETARQATDDVAFLQRVGTAALLHDVGKALISWDLLQKRGGLSPEERTEMQRHSLLGAGVLMANRETDPLAVAAAYGHHQTMGDGGYPRTCGEFHQSWVTRLVKICDVYEALTAARPYKPPMSPEKAFRTMIDMAGHFDSDLLRWFVRCVGLYPAGTRVRLDDGSLANVLSQTGDLHRPVVEVVEQDGAPVVPTNRKPLNLREAVLPGPTVVRESLGIPDAVQMLT